MGDSIEYCDKCENNVGCHLNRGCLAKERPLSPSDAATCSRLKSPADVCLNKCTTWVDFDPTKDVLEYGEGHHQIQVTIEHRAWVCPFCNQSTEYWLVNGMVTLGCGMSSLISKGKTSDCCERWACRRAQEKFHSENVNMEAPPRKTPNQEQG